MWSEIPQGWQIFIATCIFVILISVIKLIWTRLKRKFSEKRPLTYVYLFGQDKSLSLSHMKKQNPLRHKIKLHPVRFPQGESKTTDPPVPLKCFNWKYPKNAKLYTIVVQNKGDGTDKNIKISTDFYPNLIANVKISKEERMNIIEGGNPSASGVVLRVPELLPNEKQDCEILVNGNSLRKFEAWSEKRQKISKIFIFDIIF